MKKHRLIIQAAALVLVLSLFLGVGRVQADTYPTFSISAVEKDVSVTILTKDFPANKNFKVLMGEIGTRAEGGIEVATFNSGEGGAFTATFNIPAALKGRAQIAISRPRHGQSLLCLQLVLERPQRYLAGTCGTG